MFSFLNRKYPASEVAKELSKLALLVTDEHRQAINEVARCLNVPPSCVEIEYRCLKVYIVETVVQTISTECAAGQTFLATFHNAVAEKAKSECFVDKFWEEQENRIELYDTAWQDAREVGQGVAMSSALASLIRSENDLLEVTSLWLACSSLLIPLLKYLRSIRIVKG
ncbi:MAG: hypothetical protein IH984_08140 [Planctomycetes bacterium]|nr:hypothetical protein [Planctomycetota bacterium]